MLNNRTRLNVTFSTSFQTIMPKLGESNELTISTEDPYRLAISNDLGTIGNFIIVCSVYLKLMYYKSDIISYLQLKSTRFFKRSIPGFNSGRYVKCNDG